MASKVNQNQIAFIDNHIPSLTAGDYTLDITQSIESHNISDFKKGTMETRHFSVYGERFSLNPTDVQTVFPPNRNSGEYKTVLPHIVLNRSTLPWERQAQTGRTTPWLALLLFTEDELVGSSLQIVKANELTRPKSLSPFWPGTTLEKEQNKSDKVTVIDVPKKVLAAIVPTAQELTYLTHVRQVQPTGAIDPQELAIVVSNRLPINKKVMVAHLVSVENRYKDDGTFNFQSAHTDTDTIRLVSLKNWTFTCQSPKHTFAALLKQLNQGGLHSPLGKTAQAKEYLQAGNVAVPHHFRNGQKSFSWYHGPLSPINYSASAKISNLAFPNQSADNLLRFDQAVGMLDVSYAAAWELGRLLALKSKAFSISLYKWKRAHSQALKQIEQQELHPHKPHLKGSDHIGQALLMPKNIEDWFSQLSLLHDVPYNYLVPDDNMLPAESMRFFTLDPEWIACLTDGAFSIGRVTDSDHQHDASRGRQIKSFKSAPVSGFLLRSAVVAGWPALQVNGFDQAEKKLNSLRTERISPNVLLCLFTGSATKYVIHEKPETIHFGFNNAQFVKKLRTKTGEETCISINASTLNLKDSVSNKVNISALVSAVQEKIIQNQDLGITLDHDSLSVAQFAIQMVAGVQEVVFKLKG